MVYGVNGKVQKHKLDVNKTYDVGVIIPIL